MVVMFVINSKVVGLLTSRPRLYAVGVNLRKRAVLLAPTLWQEVLERVFQGMREGKPGCESYILPETHPAVEACRASLEEKHGKNKQSKSTRWPAERHKHMLVREDLAAQHALFLPDPEELPPFPDGSSSEWLDLLPTVMSS